MLKWFHQLGAITGPWEQEPTYRFYWHVRNNKEQIKQRSEEVRRCFESKEEAFSQAHVYDMGQLRGENLGHEV